MAIATIRYAVILTTFAALTACGGGGEGGDNAPTPTNTAPTISGSPTTSMNVGEAYSFTPTASDPDNDTLTFSINNLANLGNIR